MNSTNDRSMCTLKAISISIMFTPQDAAEPVNISLAYAPGSPPEPYGRDVMLLEVTADGSRRAA